MESLTITQLAERWNCHRNTIRKMLADGDIPYGVSGGARLPRRVVSIDAIEAYEAANEWTRGGK